MMQWSDGKIAINSEPLFTALDRGLSLGDGLFETVPSFNGRAYLQDRHRDRMASSARKLHLPFDGAQFDEAVAALASHDPSPAIIRVTLTRGTGQRGLALPEPQTPHLIATRTPWSKDLAFGSMRLKTATIRRNATSPTASMKTISYLDHVMAHHEARQAGADDALMLDQEGHVASTSMANLFALFGQTLFTPSAQGAILPGIMRQVLMDHAEYWGLTLISKPLHKRDLLAADHVFTTNSVRLVTSITALDDVSLRLQSESVITKIRDFIRSDIYEHCAARI